MIHFHKRSERYRKVLPQQDDLEALLDNADRLADAVLANNDDWSEGRAFAYALRHGVQKWRDAKLHVNPNVAPE